MHDGDAKGVLALLHHVRSARRGRPSSSSTMAVPAAVAGYLQWDLGDLCAFLLEALRSLPAADAVGVEGVIRCYGLAGAPQRQAAVARAGHGGAGPPGRTIGPRQLQKRMASTLAELAARLPPCPAAPGPSPGLRPPAWPGRRELRRRVRDPAYGERLALALERAMQGAREDATAAGGRAVVPLPAALRQLHADAFGPEPLDEGVPSWLRSRQRALAWTTVVAISPRLAVGPGTRGRGRQVAPPAVLAPFPVTGPRALQLGGVLASHQLGPEQVAQLLDVVQADLSDPLATYWLAAAKTGLEGLDERPPALAVRVLSLRLALEARASALRSFDTYQDLLRLAGRADPAVLTGAVDLSVMLAGHGYQEHAVEILRRHWAGLAEAGDPSRDMLGPWYRLRAAIALQKRAAGRGTRDDLRSAERTVMRLAEQVDGTGNPITGDVARVRAQVELTRAALGARASRPSSDRALSRAADLLAGPSAASAQWPEAHRFRQTVRWALVAMEHALGTHDAGAFEEALGQGASLWNGAPHVPVLGRGLHELAVMGRRRFGIDPPPLVAPAPGSGWDARFRPSPRHLGFVGGRSWVCAAGTGWRLPS